MQFQIQPDYCRQRATELARLADGAPDDKARSSYLELAAHWRHLAEEVEKPMRWRRMQR